jgi:hypothetical protein
VRESSQAGIGFFLRLLDVKPPSASGDDPALSKASAASSAVASVVMFVTDALGFVVLILT